MDQPVDSEIPKTTINLQLTPITTPIGQWLVSEKLIESEHLNAALSLQKKQGGRLGEILTKGGWLSLLNLYRALAKQHNTLFVNLLSDPPDETLLNATDLPLYLRFEALPYRIVNGKLHVVTTDAKRFLSESPHAFGQHPVTILVTSPRDIRWTLQRLFQDNFSEKSSEELRLLLPHYALKKPDKRRCCLLASVFRYASAFIAMGLVWAFPSFIVSVVLLLVSIFFLLILAFKVLLIRKGLQVSEPLLQMCKVPLAEYSVCPIYTVLVPLHKEAAAIPDLITALSALDYPVDRLEIKLIVEIDDSATRNAIIAQNPDARFHLITVPHSLPQTKPKACNYALHFATGEFVTIYDAEDAPCHSQLRQAVALFHAYPEVGCLQARLNYYNASENILTKLFSLEYAILFNILLPALYSLNIPIPLGGTSNHVRLKVLESLGGWDAYNVTEDADLGVRLASEGYRTLPFPSLTREEAPIHVSAWLKQRARWIKGYIQTWTVLARTPAIRRLQLGNVGFWGIHFFIGAASLNYMLAPFLWGITLSWLVMPPIFAIALMVQWLCWLTLGASVGVQFWAAFIMRNDSDYAPSWLTIILWPPYFMLHTIASMRALWQLVFAPHHWDKTIHGMSKIKRTP